MMGVGMSPVTLPVAADSAILAESGLLHGASIRAVAAAGTLTLYDGAIAGGKILASIGAPVNGHASVMFPKPVAFTTLRSAVVGAGVVALAYYSK